MIWDDASFCTAALLAGTMSGGASDGIGSTLSSVGGVTSVLIKAVLVGSGFAAGNGTSPAVACLSSEARREMAATMVIRAAFCPTISRLYCAKLALRLTSPVFYGGNA